MRYFLEHDESSCFERTGMVLLRELIPVHKIQQLLFLLGEAPALSERDVALHLPKVRTILFSQAIGHVAALLAKKKKLRYGGDWLFRGEKLPWAEGALSDSFCVQPLAIAAIIALTDAEAGHSGSLLPEHAGDALFFVPQQALPIPAAYGSSEQKFLLFVYAEQNAQYVLNQQDPHTHTLKQFGYVFGDRLRELTHPHIIR